MEKFDSFVRVRWECRYEIVFISKHHRKVMYGKVVAVIGSNLPDLCVQKARGIRMNQDDTVVAHSRR